MRVQKAAAGLELLNTYSLPSGYRPISGIGKYMLCVDVDDSYKAKLVYFDGSQWVSVDLYDEVPEVEIVTSERFDSSLGAWTGSGDILCSRVAFQPRSEPGCLLGWDNREFAGPISGEADWVIPGVNAGDELTFSCYLKPVSAEAMAYSEARIEYYTSGAVKISDDTLSLDGILISGVWNIVSLSGTAPANTYYVVVKIVCNIFTEYADGFYFFLDDSVLTRVVTWGTISVDYSDGQTRCISDIRCNTTNYMYFGTFDSGVSNWALSSGTDGIVGFGESTTRHSGPLGLKLVVNTPVAAPGFLSSDMFGFDGLDGLNSRISMWVNPDDVTGDLMVLLSFRDSAGDEISSDYEEFAIGDMTSGEWQLIEMSSVVPANTENLIVRLGFSSAHPSGATGNIYIDDIKMFVDSAIEIHVVDLNKNVWRIDMNEADGLPEYVSVTKVVTNAESIARVDDLLFVHHVTPVSSTVVAYETSGYTDLHTEMYAYSSYGYHISLIGAYIGHSSEAYTTDGWVPHYVLLHTSEDLSATGSLSSVSPGVIDGYDIDYRHTLQSTIVYRSSDDLMYFCSPVDALPGDFVWFETMNVRYFWSPLWQGDRMIPATIMYCEPNNNVEVNRLYRMSFVSYYGDGGFGSNPAPMIGIGGDDNASARVKFMMSYYGSLFFVGWNNTVREYSSAPGFSGGLESGWVDITDSVLSVSFSSEMQEEGVSYRSGTIQVNGDHTDAGYLRIDFGESGMHRAKSETYAPYIEEEFTVEAYVIDASVPKSVAAATTTIQFAEWLGASSAMQLFSSRSASAVKFGWDHCVDMAHWASVIGTWEIDGGGLKLTSFPDDSDSEWAIVHSTYGIDSAHGTAAVEYSCGAWLDMQFGFVFRSLGIPGAGRYLLRVTGGTAISLVLEPVDGSAYSIVESDTCTALPTNGWLGMRFRHGHCELYSGTSIENLFQSSPIFSSTKPILSYSGFVGLMLSPDANLVYRNFSFCSSGRLYNPPSALNAVIQWQKPTDIVYMDRVIDPRDSVLEAGWITVPSPEFLSGSVIFTTTRNGYGSGSGGLNGTQLTSGLGITYHAGQTHNRFTFYRALGATQTYTNFYFPDFWVMGMGGTHGVIPQVNSSGNISAVGCVYGVEYETMFYYQYTNSTIADEYKYSHFWLSFSFSDFIPDTPSGVSLHGACQYVPTIVGGFGEGVSDVISRIIPGSMVTMSCDADSAVIFLPPLLSDISVTDDLCSGLFLDLVDNEEPVTVNSSRTPHEGQTVTILSGGVESILSTHVTTPVLGNRCVVSQRSAPYTRVPSALNSQAAWYASFAARRFYDGSTSIGIPAITRIMPGSIHAGKLITSCSTNIANAQAQQDITYLEVPSE